MRGQIHVLEAAAILIGTTVSLIVASHLFTVQHSTYITDLKVNAERTLLHLLETGKINQIAYGIGPSGLPDPTLVQSILDMYVPPDYGYNLTVLNLNGETVLVVTRNFKADESAGAVAVVPHLVAGGAVEYRVVILRISR